MLQALIFDVDGTLADTENVHRVAFNRAFVTAGLDWHWNWALYRRLLHITGGKERIAYFMDTALPGVFGREERNALVAELHAIKTSYFERLTEQGSLNLRPGIAPLLLAAQDSGIRLAIASTTSPANIETLLRATLGRDSAEIFDVVSAGDSVPRKKPAPDIYLSALAELALPAAACLALEDSQNGLRAAMAAGIVTVVTPSSFTFDEDFTGASCVVETIADLANGAGRARVGSSILKALREIHARAIQCLRHGVAGG